MLARAAAPAAGGWRVPAGRDELIFGMDRIAFVGLSLEPLFRANSTGRLWRLVLCGGGGGSRQPPDTS